MTSLALILALTVAGFTDPAKAPSKPAPTVATAPAPKAKAAVVVPPGAEIAIPAATPEGPALSLVLPFDCDKADASDLAELAARVDALTEVVAGLVKAQAPPLTARAQAHGCLAACKCAIPGECGQAGCECPPRAPQPPKVTAPPAPPTLYRLADTSGQVWTHADPAWLSTYVAQRNAALAPAPRPTVYGYAVGGCANGSCYRR